MSYRSRRRWRAVGEAIADFDYLMVLAFVALLIGAATLATILAGLWGLGPAAWISHGGGG